MKAHTDPQIAYGFQYSILYYFVTILCRQQAAIMENHNNERNVHNIGQVEATHTKYERLKFGDIHTALEVTKLPL